MPDSTLRVMMTCLPPDMRRAAVALLALFLFPLAAHAQRQMEALGRGVVAVHEGANRVYVGWRLLGTDASDIAFNLYRSTGGGTPVRLNDSPLTQTTDFVDTAADTSQSLSYFVRPVSGGTELAASTSFTLAANAPVLPYLSIPITPPDNGVTPLGTGYSYTANDCGAADLDGDGEYELIVKWDPTNAKDNSQSGHTGNVFLDAYKLNGSRLWRIDLGINIRAGAHYTQFQVYDLDGDGRAELACKTAPGSKDATGAFVATTAARFAGALPSFDPNADHRNSGGYILTGHEFLTIFHGETGAELMSALYTPARNNDVTSANVSAWGDNYGNRVDRFLAGVAYLDGERPSLVMCRGYYTRAVIAAWDWRDGQLTQRWIFDTEQSDGSYLGYRAQGNHQLSIGDVDGDGKDEIMYGACAVDDSGAGLFNTGLGHGDALHMSDMDPDRPGLEVWQPHESPSQYGANAAEFRDARTGALIFGVQATGDIGRGVAFDVDPRFRGYEMWASGGTGGMYTAQQSTPDATLGARGVQISSTKPSINFGVWWDADPLRELLDGTTVSKWNWNSGSAETLLSATGAASNNGTKATPALSADLLGDWREEVVLRASDSLELRVYTTTIPATSRLYTLMHDPQYRVAVAWQNTGYNQPPHPSFFLGDGMSTPPTPAIRTVYAAPRFTGQPSHQSASPGASITLTSSATTNATYQWQHNGTPLAGAASASLTLNGLEPASAGLYTATAINGTSSSTSEPAIVGLTSSEKVVGAGTEVGSDIVHQNGNTFDQVLLQGAAAAVVADSNKGHILRLSCIDLSHDIVQVEFSGPGTLSLVLDGPSGPAKPVNYDQDVLYMRGHIGIVLTGATENTHLSVFSVGRANAVNQSLFYDNVVYDGTADIAFIAISSVDGKFGGLRTANANFVATKGVTGLYAPGVEFTGPVYIGNISASDDATPMLVVGSASGDTRITGGDLFQANGRAVEVRGLTQLRFTDGSTSHGGLLPAQVNRGRLEQDGNDVTAEIVVNP